MEKRKELGAGLLGLGSLAGSDLNVPVSSSSGSISPYMNFDPAYLNIDSEAQFIIPEGGTQKRGRFELAFSQIGSSVCAGGAVGGLHGLYSGIRDTKEAQLAASVRRTQLINSISKKGASAAQSLGVIALLYSILGVGVSKLRGAEDELNTLTAATFTGMLYKLPSDGLRAYSTRDHLKRVMRGGTAGLLLATAYCLYTSKDRLKQIVGLQHN